MERCCVANATHLLLIILFFYLMRAIFDCFIHVAGENRILVELPYCVKSYIFPFFRG